MYSLSAAAIVRLGGAGVNGALILLRFALGAFLHRVAAWRVEVPSNPVWSKYQRSPVAFSTRPSRLTSASALCQRGQTGRTSRRPEAVLRGLPFWTVRAKAGAGERSQNTQRTTARV